MNNESKSNKVLNLIIGLVYLSATYIIVVFAIRKFDLDLSLYPIDAYTIEDISFRIYVSMCFAFIFEFEGMVMMYYYYVQKPKFERYNLNELNFRR